MNTLTTELTPEVQKQIQTIQKLLNLAAKAGTPEEAASATAKAQELMNKYNLESATIERQAGKDGKREELKVDGGFYEYQRNLWRAVAELNFCVYWTQMYRAEAYRYVDRYTGAKSMKKTEDNERKRVDVLKYRHALVGRIVNTRTTTHMAQYLLQAIERQIEERLTLRGGLGKHDNEQSGIDKQSNWAHSLRYGIAERVIERIEDERRTRLSKSREEARAAAKAAGNTTTSTALTLSTYVDLETDANMDYIHGEGWSAEQARERQEMAMERKRAREEYAQWAAANPEEARKRAEEAEKEARRYRGGGGEGSRGGLSSRERRMDYSAYATGRKMGDGISLHQQAESRQGPTRRITGSKDIQL